MQQQKSKLGEIRFRTTDNGEEIFDCLRRKFVVLTPEEKVRQAFVRFLVNQCNFPPSLMANEVGIRQNGRERRCDTIVYGRDGKPVMIVEYKAPTVKITQAVFDQIYRYNLVLRVKYLVVYNGNCLYCCRADYNRGKVDFLSSIPSYDSL